MNAGADESHSSPRTSKSVASRRFRARQRLERPHWHHQVMDTTETLPSATCSEVSYPLNVRIILVLMTVPTTATQDCCRKYSNGVLRILPPAAPTLRLLWYSPLLISTTATVITPSPAAVAATSTTTCCYYHQYHHFHNHLPTTTTATATSDSPRALQSSLCPKP